MKGVEKLPVVKRSRQDNSWAFHKRRSKVSLTSRDSSTSKKYLTFFFSERNSTQAYLSSEGIKGQVFAELKTVILCGRRYLGFVPGRQSPKKGMNSGMMLTACE